MIELIESLEHLREVQEKYEDFLVLVFYGNFSFASKRALTELEKVSKESKDIPVYSIDVGKVKGIHKQFGVEKVPTVLVLEKEGVIRRIEGVESAQFYSRIFFGADPLRRKKREKGRSHRVIVYSGQGCPACGTARAYLRRRDVSFRVVDISHDQNAAERLARRSGQMAVPQIDIDGHLVVGFDQAKIDRLRSN